MAGIRDGNQLPTSPELQAVGTAAYNWTMGSNLESYVRFTVQYVGSSFTQLGDEEPNFGLISNSATPAAGFRAPDRARRCDCAPTSSSTRSCRRTRSAICAGASARIAGKPSLFVNNLWDERAFLSVDRERGRSARVGYLTNPPRTYGVNFRMNF